MENWRICSDVLPSSVCLPSIWKATERHWEERTDVFLKFASLFHRTLHLSRSGRQARADYYLGRLGQFRLLLKGSYRWFGDLWGAIRACRADFTPPPKIFLNSGRWFQKLLQGPLHPFEAVPPPRAPQSAAVPFILGLAFLGRRWLSQVKLSEVALEFGARRKGPVRHHLGQGPRVFWKIWPIDVVYTMKAKSGLTW